MKKTGMQGAGMAELRDVWDGIRLQPGRTALSFLAVGVGMTALTVLLAALGGLQMRARVLLDELGGRVFAVTSSGKNGGATDGRLNRAQADLLAASLPDCEVCSLRSQDIDLPGQGVPTPVTVVSTDEHLLRIRNWRVVRGRFLDAADVRYGERSAAISRALSRVQGWEVGRTRDVGGVPYTIVGIVDAESSAMQSENVSEGLRLGERSVFIPRTAMGAGAERNPARDEVSAILVRVPAGGDMAACVGAARRVLGPGNPYAWVTPDTILSGVRRLQATIGWTVGSVAALCLLLGGTTLMSLMVANVRDRVTEIGLRRALGARPADIARLFVLEGALVTGVAALVGIGATHAVLWAGGGRLPVPLRLDWVTVLAPLLFAVAVGGLFSYWPARLAARISPADALRAE